MLCWRFPAWGFSFPLGSSTIFSIFSFSCFDDWAILVFILLFQYITCYSLVRFYHIPWPIGPRLLSLEGEAEKKSNSERVQATINLPFMCASLLPFVFTFVVYWREAPPYLYRILSSMHALVCLSLSPFLSMTLDIALVQCLCLLPLVEGVLCNESSVSLSSFPSWLFVLVLYYCALLVLDLYWSLHNTALPVYLFIYCSIQNSRLCTPLSCQIRCVLSCSLPFCNRS